MLLLGNVKPKLLDIGLLLLLAQRQVSQEVAVPQVPQEPRTTGAVRVVLVIEVGFLNLSGLEDPRGAEADQVPHAFVPPSIKAIVAERVEQQESGVGVVLVEREDLVDFFAERLHQLLRGLPDARLVVDGELLDGFVGVERQGDE